MGMIANAFVTSPSVTIHQPLIEQLQYYRRTSCVFFTFGTRAFLHSTQLVLYSLIRDNAHFKTSISELFF